MGRNLFAFKILKKFTNKIKFVPSQIAKYQLFQVIIIQGTPIILSLTFKWGLDWKLTGIWVGFGLANFILLALFILVLITTD